MIEVFASLFEKIFSLPLNILVGSRVDPLSLFWSLIIS